VPALATDRELQPASPRLVALAAEAATDPRLAELRTDLSLTVGATKAQDELDEKLREAIARGNWNLVRQIGSRALPLLEEAVLAGIADFPEYSNNDPYSQMLRVSERSAAAFALRHLDSGGYVFRRRVLRAMGEASVLENQMGNYGERPSTYEPRPCLVQEWPRIEAALLADPDLVREAMALLGGMLLADGVTPEVTSGIRVALANDPDLASDVLREVDEARRRISGQRESRVMSAKGIYEILLGHRDAAVRRFAALALLDFPERDALWARADDADAIVRRAVADSLRSHYVNQWFPSVRPKLTPNAIAALRVLLRDPDDGVRTSAVKGLVALDKPLEPAVYRGLLDDPSAEVRELLARLEHPDDALMRDALEALAADPSEAVRHELDEGLEDTDSWWARQEVLLPAIRIRLLDPSMDANLRQQVIRKVVGTESGFLAVMDCVIDSPDDSLWRAVSGLSNSFRSSTGSSMQALGALRQDRLSVLISRLARSDLQWFSNLLGSLVEFPKAWNAAFDVMRDEDAPISSRFLAAQVAAQLGGAPFRDAFVELVGAHPDHARREAENGSVETLMRRVPGSARNELVWALLSSGSAPSELLTQAAIWYEPSGLNGRQISQHIVERWLTDSATSEASLPMEIALRHLASVPDALKPEVLERAARHPVFTKTALDVIGQLQDPRYLPVLKDALSPSWTRDQRTVATQAVSLIASYPGDEAAEILLDAMVSSPEPNVRQRCAAELDQRRARLDQRDAWLRASEQRLTETGAVERLLALLKDADPAIRAEAARGLATLKAVEALPVLIEMLRDDDAGVVKAAREALDRLNALAAEASGE